MERGFEVEKTMIMKWTSVTKENIPSKIKGVIFRQISTKIVLSESTVNDWVEDEYLHDLEFLDEYASQSTPSATDGVYGVDLDWGIKYHKTNLSNVMQASDCRFIGTGKECADFIRDHKPSATPILEGVDKYEDVHDWMEDKMYEIIDHLDTDSEGLIIGRTDAARQCIQAAKNYAVKLTPPTSSGKVGEAVELQDIEDVKAMAKQFSEIPRNINTNEQGAYSAGIRVGFVEGYFLSIKKYSVQFAEWASKNYWHYNPNTLSWYNTHSANRRVLSTELHKIYQDTKSI